MWKAVLAGTSALAVVGSTLVFAQQPPSGPNVQPPRVQETDRAKDRDAFLEARIAALHAGLMLTPDQERNWPVFEQAAREMAKVRTEGWRERPDERPAADPIERLQRRADELTRRAAALKRLADAAAPLYRSLDEGQKRRFLALARPMSPGVGGWHGRMGPRFGGDDRDDFRGPRGMGPYGRDWGYHGFGRGMDPHHWRGEGGYERGPYGMGPGMGGRGWYDGRSEFQRGPDAPRRELPRQEEEERL